MSCKLIDCAVLSVLSWLLFVVTVVGSDDACSKAQSRLARRFFSQEVEPLYAKLSLSVPRLCPLHADFDIYALVEGHKYEESSTRWVCGMCGKAFYEERFLDTHFDNRHDGIIRKGSGVVCLADFCDIFRCDVVSGKRKPQYWDVALCRERDLHRMQYKCQEIVEKCTPKDVPETTASALRVLLNSTVCDYLTCDMYWEIPDKDISPLNLAVYTILTIVLVFGLVVYYYVAYTHFYTSESLWDSNPQPELDPDYHRQPGGLYQGPDLRYRGLMSGNPS